MAVASDQALIAESVRAALSGRGYDALVLRWPSTRVEPPSRRAARRARPSTRRRSRRQPDVVLVLSDLDRPDRISAAQLLISHLGAPCLVLAGAERGPLWGAVLDSGASLVLPTSTSLDEVTELLPEVADGTRVTGARRRRELVRAWRDYAEEQERLTVRLSSLTNREAEVLRLLYAGETVRTIVATSQVTEATVRSQVRAILRKLDVKSQVAAVAAYERVRHVGHVSPAPPARRR